MTRRFSRLFGATPEQLPGAPPPLHVLLLEDSAADADLILHELRRGGYEPVARRVVSRGEMLEALSDGSWQIVLLDYSLKDGETALEALASLAEFSLDLPAILVAGVIGAEEVADALRVGARDFVSKGNLTRLVPAVARELAQVEARRQQRDGEEALRQSEQRLRLALDAGGMGWWENDLVSGQLHLSDKLELMFGLEPGAFGGTYAEFIGLVHPDDRELVGASIEQAITLDAPATVYRALWPDGTVHWHERKSQRVGDADGRFKLITGVTFDVTEREEAAQALGESEERFRLIAEQARDLIALFDDEGRYLYLSPSWESILGYPAVALLGTVVSELIHPDDWPEGTKLGAGQARELRLRKADGAWLWVEALIYGVEGRDASRLAVIARDISERKRAEVERQLLEEELRQAHKLDEVVERLRELDRLKDEFIAVVSHELRTPLTSIIGYLELMQNPATGELSKEQREFAAIIERNAQRLLHVMSDLLSLAQIESGKFRLELGKADLAALAEDAVESARPAAERRHIVLTLTAEPVPALEGDHTRLAQLLDNLISNALKFTPEGGRVEIGVRTEGGSAVLEVTDSGMGISAEEQERLFERFFRTAAATDSGIQGTGLGLAITKAIVSAHGGTISVESEEGHGTVFRVQLPLRQTESA